MHIADGIAYGDEPEEIEIVSARVLSYHILILTFSNGETRFFDGTLLDGPVFEPLKDRKIFEDFSINYGVITWANGTIDCSPEFMYDHSYEYTPPAGIKNAASAGNAEQIQMQDIKR